MQKANAAKANAAKANAVREDKAKANAAKGNRKRATEVKVVNATAEALSVGVPAWNRCKKRSINCLKSYSTTK